MEPKKYYWIKYIMIIPGFRTSCVETYYDATDVHPFIYIATHNEEERVEGCCYELDDWKTITIDDYNLWKELNK